MAQSRDPSPIIFILLFLILAAGGGYWFFWRQPSSDLSQTTVTSANTDPALPQPTQPETPPREAFSKPTSVPPGTVVRIDGSTSMVSLNQTLKEEFERQFPNTSIITQANGSDKGIRGLLSGQVDIAAVSRPLSAGETAEGLVAFPVVGDRIAIAIGNSNPLSQGLASGQVKDIFQGKITNWSQVGGPDLPIQVINRPAISGTHQVFRELVLQGEPFGTTPNITILERDATTPMLRQLGNDGIGYATAAQIINQQTVRAIAIDGILPEFSGYPYTRTLFYVYQNPPSDAVKAFLGMVEHDRGN
ncbi:phosphate ABC transporter substrate-binding protein [Roseofilum casamattae]|uniref:Phosphate ABC transporter substrate-binding protein n=1 Tax=Roseofilum casamattae BLCC-M143 TaxID=3022442 RepID=A0ABT7BT83_9CYAN|nr:phosphate ABC transporter substrate-binding protein [Roseofilum casamattae]MDJ1182285.1 phosphate ABC transporter substrate-binding protein [Roseofilum casamattae BLCC-M143]